MEAVGVPSWSMKDDPAGEQVRREGPDLALDDAATDSPAMRPVASSNVRAPLVNDEPNQADSAEPEAPHVVIEIEQLVDDTDLLVDDDESSMFRQIPVEAVLIDDASLEMEIELEEEALIDFGEPEESERASADEARPAAEMSRAVEAARLESSLQPKSVSVASTKKVERPIQKGDERRILRDVKLHFRIKDWEGAVPLIELLVRIAPSKGTYRGMLARAMSRHPVMRKDAEEHFVAALRLAPQDPELHYWLGLYYQSFGLKSRALTEFRATLHLAPRHEGARKQLSGEKKADSLRSLVKRIFE